MIRAASIAITTAGFAGPAFACDMTSTVLDKYLAPEAERNAAITACIANGSDVNASPEGFSVLRQDESALMATVLGACHVATGFALLNAGGRLDDMHAPQARAAAEHATRNCTQTDHERAFLAQLSETTQ